MMVLTVSVFSQEISHDGVNLSKIIKNNKNIDKSATVIWSEDFSSGFPSNWSRSSSSAGGFALCNWEWSMDGSWGYWNGNQGASPNSAINSTTASNGFLICDPDSVNHNSYGQPSGTTYQYLTSYFTTSAINTMGYSNVSLEFEHSFRFNNSINLEVLISNDSISWHPYFVQGSATNNQASANPEYLSLNISNIAGNQSTVYVKIGWSARVYFWMIDDMKIVETPEHKLDLLEANYGGWYTTPIANGFGLDYTFYPQNQAMAQPYIFEGVVANLGGQNQNTKLHVNVTNAIGSLLSSVSSADSLIVIGDTTTFKIDPGFSPTTIGPYEFAFWASSDSTITDTLTSQSIVTDTIYGRDNGTQSSWYGLGRTCGGMIIGVYYDVFLQDDVTSVSVFIDNQSVSGSNIYVALYEIDANNDKILLDQSNDYTLLASDIDSWVTIPFVSPVTIIPGKHMAAVGGYTHPVDTSTIGMSKYAEPTTCYIQKNGCLNTGQTFGNWYWTSRIPMIRMNFGSNSPPSSVLEDKEIEFLVYPNPSKGIFTIDFSNNNKHIITIENLLGQEVYSNIYFGTSTTEINLSGYRKGVYLINISDQKNTYSQKILID